MEDFDVGFAAAYKAGSGQLYTSAVSEALKASTIIIMSPSIQFSAGF